MLSYRNRPCRKPTLRNLDLPLVFGKHKKNGIDINNLLKTLVSLDFDRELYWDTSNIWNNDGDVVTLYNRDDKVVDDMQNKVCK
jgi:hypothetical protein